MRLGGPIFTAFDSADGWAHAVISAGYSASYCPLTPDVDDLTIQEYARAANEADIVIAEVGAWSNPLSRDPIEAKIALETCKASLALADKIGARCCLNISGSRGHTWDGPDEANTTSETFDMIVSVVRDIIDTVQPTRTYYTLELMPWMYPDSPDAYVELIQAIDREAFAVHLDPVNIISSPQLYFSNRELLKECFKKLGPYIKSCHAKDIRLSDNLTVHLDEVRPGLGRLDYPTFLHGLNRLDKDTPLMLEHLPTEQAYQAAARYIRSIATTEGLVV